MVNTFPVNGMRPDGECNYEGVQLMPGTLTGGKNNACAGATLSVRDNQLVGITADGGIASHGATNCVGDALKGTSFVLRSWILAEDGTPQAITVHIADVISRYQADPAQGTRMAYRLTDDAGNSLCSAKGSATARQNLGITAVEGLTDPGDSRKDVAIAVHTELYDADGHAYPVGAKWRVQEPEWLELACVDDALAKRSLYDLYTDDIEVSRSALMMFIANYCGDLHATMRGAKIEWAVFDDTVPGPRTTTSTLLEAKWAPDGAACMSNPRALYAQGPEATLPHDPLGDLLDVQKNCPTCTDPKSWADVVRACSTFAAKHPPPAPVPTCEACTTPGCQGRLLHSYVVPADAGAR